MDMKKTRHEPFKTWEWVTQSALLTPQEKRLAGLAPLLPAASYLVKVGSPGLIEREAATIRDAISILQKHMGPFVNRDTKDLSFVARAIEGRAKAARLAEDYLARSGWRFNPSTRKITAKAGRKGRAHLNLCIRGLSVEYGADAYGRRRIKERLSAIFDVELDAGPRGNIARALENQKRPPKR